MGERLTEQQCRAPAAAELVDYAAFPDGWIVEHLPESWIRWALAARIMNERMAAAGVPMRVELRAVREGA